MKGNGRSKARGTRSSTKSGSRKPTVRGKVRRGQPGDDARGTRSTSTEPE